MLMSHDQASHHCFFARQPGTKAETDSAILGLYVSCCGAVRYGGRDRGILIRLAELGVAYCCDYPLDDEPKPANVNHATFEFVDPSVGDADRSGLARQIMEYLSNWFAARPISDHRVVDFRCAATRVSFRHEWGYGGKPNIHSVTYELQPHEPAGWLLLALRDEGPTTGIGMGLHEAIGRDTRFRNVRWFTKEEFNRGDGEGRLLPF
jgi:hypothetical protein